MTHIVVANQRRVSGMHRAKGTKCVECSTQKWNSARNCAPARQTQGSYNIAATRTRVVTHTSMASAEQNFSHPDDQKLPGENAAKSLLKRCECTLRKCLSILVRSTLCVHA